MMEWRKIPGFTRYSVSEFGDVRRDERIYRSAPGLVSRVVNDRGYFKVAITGDDGRHRTITVHTLVALAFLGERPAGKEICHRDGVPKNVNYRNLYYGTKAENDADKARHGKQPKGSGHKLVKLTDEAVFEIRRLAAKGELTQAQIGRRFGVSQRAVWQIHHRKRWKHL